MTIPQNLHEVSKDENDEIIRMRIELEKKDRELKDAHRLIEEIKKNSKKHQRQPLKYTMRHQGQERAC